MALMMSRKKSGGNAKAANFTLTSTTAGQGVSFNLSTYGMSELKLIYINEQPQGYSEGTYVKNIETDTVIKSVDAGGSGTKTLTINGDVVNVDFENNVGQTRTFVIAIAGD